ncbi:MAG TPA: precorrin-6y C5,15-methyltransferase (decarboxylating) subunit CbiE [Syntrophales bacterium]|nr:precorrin-6y C5,15-methyltransferase (decarboxylating) subunit CbiE [Syntrophales bacterium]
MEKKPRLIIAGCGPGSPDYLTPAAIKAALQAEVLVGASRLLELFPGSSAEKVAVGGDVEKALSEIASLLGKRIVILVTGDPGLCSLAVPVIKRFGGNRCEIIPGVSSVQVAFARIGMDWLGAKIIDAHGENPCITASALADEGKIAIFAGRREAIRWIGGIVTKIGEGRRIYLCENLTLKDEHVRQIQQADFESIDASSRSIVLIIREDLF